MHAHALPPELAAMLMGQNRKNKSKVLDRIPFPRAKVRQLLELADRCKELKGKLGGHQAHIDMWNFIYDSVPAVRNKTLHINTANSLQPMLEVTGNYVPPQVGHKRDGRTIIGMQPIPADKRHRIMELSDCEENGLVARYELWEELGRIWSNVADNPERNYAVVLEHDWCGILELADGDEDEG